MSSSQNVLIYTVSFTVNDSSGEEVFFTQERAEGFVAGIEEAGGTASITEDCKNVTITPVFDPETGEDGPTTGEEADQIVWPEKGN